MSCFEIYLSLVAFSVWYNASQGLIGAIRQFLLTK